MFEIQYHPTLTCCIRILAISCCYRNPTYTARNINYLITVEQTVLALLLGKQFVDATPLKHMGKYENGNFTRRYPLTQNRKQVVHLLPDLTDASHPFSPVLMIGQPRPEQPFWRECCGNI